MATVTAQVSGYAPNASVVLDFYAYYAVAQSPARVYLGSDTVQTDSTGGGTFSGLPLSNFSPGEPYISATATGPDNSTSGFSSSNPPVQVTVETSSPLFNVNSTVEGRGLTLADAIANATDNRPSPGTTDIITFDIPSDGNVPVRSA